MVTVGIDKEDNNSSTTTNTENRVIKNAGFYASDLVAIGDDLGIVFSPNWIWSINGVEYSNIDTVVLPRATMFPLQTTKVGLVAEFSYWGNTNNEIVYEIGANQGANGGTGSLIQSPGPDFVLLTTSTAVNLQGLATKTDLNNKVSLTGNETINGVKTFIDSPMIPDGEQTFEAVNFGQLDKKEDKKPNTFEWVANFNVFGIGYQDIEIGSGFSFYGDIDIKLSECFVYKNYTGLYNRIFYDFYIYNGSKSPHLQKTLFFNGKINVSAELLFINQKLIIRIHYNIPFSPPQFNILLVKLLFTSPFFNVSNLNPIIKPYVTTGVIAVEEQKQLPVTTTRMVDIFTISKTITDLDDQHHFIFNNPNPCSLILSPNAMRGMKFSITQKGAGAVTASGNGVILRSNLPSATTQFETRTYTKSIGNEWIVEGFVPSNVVLPYKSYVAIIKKTAPNNESATVVQNTIGTINFARINVGDYRFTNSQNLFTANKTVVFISHDGNNASTARALVVDTLSVMFQTMQFSTGAFVDETMAGTNIEIRVYN